MSKCSRREFVKTLGLGAAAMAAPRLAVAAPRRKPNIVFFLVDDMGWMDSSVYGSQYYETPNMERLAKRSMLFTDAYAASPLCSPTRASIVTGKYPGRLHITTPVCHRPPYPPGTPEFPEKAAPSRKVLLPRSRRFLPPGEHTIAEALCDAGYKTAHIGKWHLGLNPEHWPEEQGFEVSFHGAPDPGPPSYFSPYEFKAGTVADGPKGEYITDRVTDEALKFVESHKDGPFLLHLWHYAVHGPWGHKEEITKRFADKKDPRGKQANPIMASMLKSVDESLGRVMDKLDELGIADNTIIIFFSDNGGNVHSNRGDDAKLAKIKPGHRRWPFLQDWRKYAGDLGPTNNAPLRGGKATIFEGGTREPMMVCWPGVVQPNSTCSEVVSSVDWYPTMLEMAGIRPKAGKILDGVSLLPLLTQAGTLEREAIFCHFPHGFGKRSPAATWVRKGDWKLIRVYETSEWFPDEHLLYNLKHDIGETTNLAAKRPDKVKELDALITQHLRDTDAAVPKPNPAYNPKMQPVAGWRPLGFCELSLNNGHLVMESKQRRVQMHTNQVPAIGGKLTMKFHMRAKGERFGILYWTTRSQPQFVREVRKDFKPQFDDQWHEYAVTFEPAEPITKIRFDPVITPGRVELEWLRLCQEDGTVVKAWEFGR